MNKTKRYIALFSLHGLVRGENIELGRDADTGGQIKYVVELARELGKHEQVSRVDLFTRQIYDAKVSDDYAKPIEEIGENANIIRLHAGPRRYLRKEALWNHLESFIDQTLPYFRQLGQIPYVIHGHYADAGYVGSILAHLLGVPFIFTGHSLGVVKKARMLEKGMNLNQLQEKYNINYRIEAEERALNVASMVVTSTYQEIHDQYEPYQHYEPDRMVVIPPGVDLDRFYYIQNYQADAHIIEKLSPFLRDPNKPMILALSRADDRKNIPALIQAYGENPQLQQLANLVIIAGNRDDLTNLNKSSQQIWRQILYLIDLYNLYGRVAYPKQHESNDVPEFFRLATALKGVFVNPALTEPFGLTLIEAAATGLPILATNDGGPIDIINNCNNGLLIDPLDTNSIAEALVTALSNNTQWEQWSRQGIAGVKKHYSWFNHVNQYLKNLDKLIAKLPTSTVYRQGLISHHKKRHLGLPKLPLTQRFIITDIDQTLIGDVDALEEFLEFLDNAGDSFSFGIATAHKLERALELLDQWNVPLPEVLITSVGSEIYYGSDLKDTGWEKHINYRWEPEAVKQILSSIEGIELQDEKYQDEFKISYILDKEMTEQKILRRAKIVKCLREQHLLANVIITYNQHLDLLPIRASKGLAVRYLANRWGLPMAQFLVAGDSGNDEDMLKGDALGVIVGNYSSELEKLKGKPRIYFAKAHYAKGILEGIKHFGFLHDTLNIDDEYASNAMASNEY
jgi:sucrose-phosphate synthase